MSVAPGHLLARHDLFQRRQFQNHAKDCGHRAMAGKSLIVEDEVLEFAAFNGHVKTHPRCTGHGDGAQSEPNTRGRRTRRCEIRK
jgi:hypothetical protein